MVFNLVDFSFFNDFSMIDLLLTPALFKNINLLLICVQKDYEDLALSVMSIVDRLVHKTKVLFSLSLSLSPFGTHSN